MQKLRKPRKECGGALRGLDAHPVPDDGGRQGARRGQLLAGARLRSAAVGCRHVGPTSGTVALSAPFGFFIFFLNYYQAFLPLIMERAKALVKERLWSLDLAVAASLVYLLCASTLAS